MPNDFESAMMMKRFMLTVLLPPGATYGDIARAMRAKAATLDAMYAASALDGDASHKAEATESSSGSLICTWHVDDPFPHKPSDFSSDYCGLCQSTDCDHQ